MGPEHLVMTLAIQSLPIFPLLLFIIVSQGDESKGPTTSLSLHLAPHDQISLPCGPAVIRDHHNHPIMGIGGPQNGRLLDAERTWGLHLNMQF